MAATPESPSLPRVKTKTSPHGRFAYGAYFDGPPRSSRGASSIWMLDPHWAAAFPTDSGLVFYAAMPTKDRLPEFKRDPEGGLVSFVADVPEAPPIRASRKASPVIGKIEMPNKVRVPVAPGLALVGDAALAVDPLFGVGCGWALQSAEWLATAWCRPCRRGAPARRPCPLPAAPPAHTARPRAADQRPGERQEAEPRRAAALLRRRPRPAGGGALRGLWHPQHRPGPLLRHGDPARDRRQRASCASRARAATGAAARRPQHQPFVLKPYFCEL